MEHPWISMSKNQSTQFLLSNMKTEKEGSRKDKYFKRLSPGMYNRWLKF